jgi:Dna[CI] antecedent, DciA
LDRLADDVQRELSRFGPQAEIGRLARAWPAAVGEQIARNAWPARVARDGTLHVHTSSSAWAFELAQLEKDVRSRLGDLAPKRLRFAPGPLPEPEPEDRDAARQDAVSASPEERETAAALAAEIADEKLRNLVARAAAASLARARGSRPV